MATTNIVPSCSGCTIAAEPISEVSETGVFVPPSSITGSPVATTNVYMVFRNYLVTSVLPQNGNCITTIETHTLQTAYSAIEPPGNNVASAQQQASSQFFSYLGLPTCVPGTFTETITGMLPTLGLSILNVTVKVTDSGPQTTNTIPLVTNTSSSTTTNTSALSSSTSTTPTDRSRGVKIGVGVAVPVFIIASLTLGIVLWWWYRRRSRPIAVHEGATTHTQKLQTQDQQPFLQQKAELEVEERRELEAVERRYEIQGVGRRLELSAGEVSLELPVHR